MLDIELIFQKCMARQKGLCIQQLGRIYPRVQECEHATPANEIRSLFLVVFVLFAILYISLDWDCL